MEIHESGKKINRRFKLRFIDSFRFLSTSIAKLAESLKEEECIELKKHFAETFDLVRHKGVFPYSYVDD